MGPFTRARARQGVVAICATALLATACGGGSGGSSSGEQESGGDGASTSNLTAIGLVNQTEATARQGGSLTYAEFAESSSLDPAVSSGNGAAGGNVLGALYDTLVRFDSETNDYAPQLAESLDPNDDFSVWTLKLRPDVTFTDGTPLNAQAVLDSLQHYVDSRGLRSQLIIGSVADMKAADDLTVVFTLKKPWSGFPYLLASQPGNIVSPTAVKKAGKDFGKSPVGAGPFKLSSYRPGEATVLERNPDYWGGDVYLDSIRFITLRSPQAVADSLKTGQINGAYLRDPKVIESLLADNYPGFHSFDFMNEMLINNGAGDQQRPGSNVKIRQAIAYAIDPKLVNQRTYGVDTFASSEIFPSFSRWHSSAGPQYDPEKAKALLAEVKESTGYDGTLNMACYNQQQAQQQGLVEQALLKAVGFNVVVKNGATVADQIRTILVDRDYDIACTWSFGVDESDPYVALSNSLRSTAGLYGVSDPQMDELLDKAQAAGTDEAKKQAYAEIQQRWNETVPQALTGASPVFSVWDKKVHGIKDTVGKQILFDKAFIAQ